LDLRSRIVALLQLEYTLVEVVSQRRTELSKLQRLCQLQLQLQ